MQDVLEKAVADKLIGNDNHEAWCCKRNQMCKVYWDEILRKEDLA